MIDVTKIRDSDGKQCPFFDCILILFVVSGFVLILGGNEDTKKSGSFKELHYL